MSGHRKCWADGELNLPSVILRHTFSCMEGMLPNICLHTETQAEVEVVKLCRACGAD